MKKLALFFTILLSAQRIQGADLSGSCTIGTTNEKPCPPGHYCDDVSGNILCDNAPLCDFIGYFCPAYSTTNQGNPLEEYNGCGDNDISACSCPTTTTNWTFSNATGLKSIEECEQTQTPVNCATGTIKQNGVFDNDSTPKNKWGDTSTTTPLIAKAGYYVNGTSCDICTGATWSAGGAINNCHSCGTYAFDKEDGKTAQNQCKIQCAAGTQIAEANDTNCTTPTGSWYIKDQHTVNYGGKSVPSECPSDYTTPNTTNAGDHNDITDCKITCPTDRYKSGPQTICDKDCAPGTYAPSHTSAYDSPDSCSACTNPADTNGGVGTGFIWNTSGNGSETGCTYEILSCAEDYYKSGNSCIQCDVENGFHSPAGSTNANQCVKSCALSCKCPTGLPNGAVKATCDTDSNVNPNGTENQVNNTCEGTKNTCTQTITSCAEDYYKSGNSCIQCDVENGFHSPAGSTSVSACTKPCTLNCSCPELPNGAESINCTAGSSHTKGTQVEGGECDAPASTCAISATSCQANYYLEAGDCKKCDLLGTGYHRDGSTSGGPETCVITCANDTYKTTPTDNCQGRCEDGQYRTEHQSNYDSLDTGCTSCTNIPENTNGGVGTGFIWKTSGNGIATGCEFTITSCDADFYLDSNDCKECNLLGIGYHREGPTSGGPETCVISCPIDTYKKGQYSVCDGECSNGQYVEAQPDLAYGAQGIAECHPCTNKPAGANDVDYTGKGNGENNCAYNLENCGAGYYFTATDKKCDPCPGGATSKVGEADEKSDCYYQADQDFCDSNNGCVKLGQIFGQPVNDQPMCYFNP